MSTRLHGPRSDDRVHPLQPARLEKMADLTYNRDVVVDPWFKNYHNPQMDLVREADTLPGLRSRDNAWIALRFRSISLPRG
jgi:hypothetical protein